MESVNEACNRGKKDCSLSICGKRVVSFFKVIIDERCLEVLFFPPKFARSVSDLTDQETYLEDSSGQRWRITVCIHNGSLAIRQGWPEFLSEHGVDVGKFLVFHHFPSSKNFVVQIFGTSGCEKDCGLLIQGKRVVSFFKVMIDEHCLEVLFFPPKFARSVLHLIDQETYLEDSRGRRWRVTVCIHNGSLGIRQGWPEFLSEHGVDMANFLVFHYVPASKHFIVQIFGTSGCEKIKVCSDIDKGKKPEESTHVTYEPTIADNEKEQLVPSPIYVDEFLCMINRDAQYDQDDDRLCLHLSSFEMPEVKPLAEGTSSPFKGDNANETNQLGSLTEPLLPTFEAGITATDCMVGKPSEDIPLLGTKDHKSNEASPSEDTPSFNAVSYSCLVDVDGRDFLELPESWRKYLSKSEKLGRWIIYLQGPDKRTWPIYYHSRPGFDVLTSGWNQVTTAYGLNAEDNCLFQLVNQRERLFDVRKI
ncbi:hypothetical protein HAX54_016246 [Datura stramonium]|uniref:TF-B3 domain-containing protein n=1 Tax=Datura stramonium TaxID=4076 RepID=A0ABS8UIJ3_DATST|nr:hypothetical protein [Datura stramonium]